MVVGTGSAVVGFVVVGVILLVDAVVGLMVVVVFGVIGGMLVVDSAACLVVGTGVVVVVVCLVVVWGAVGCWVGAGLLTLLDECVESSCMLTVVEGPGLLEGNVLVGGGGSEIDKSTEAFVVAIK